MLFISRCAGRDKWGVTDTDDNKEQVVSENMIRKSIASGIEIKGVTSSIFDNGRVYLKRVEVYQPALPGAGASAKAKMFYGVDISLNGDTLLGIRFDSNVIKDGARIRLSTFASKCENFVFRCCSYQYSKFTVVIDDKIACKCRSFQNFFMMGNVQLDITEVTRDKTAQWAYLEYLLSHNGDPRRLHECIIDTPERGRLWDAIRAVYSGVLYLQSIRPEEQKAVADMFYKTFEKVSQMNIEIGTSKATNRWDLESYTNAAYRDREFWRSYCQDFDLVYRHQKDLGSGLFSAIIHCMRHNHYGVAQFSHYMEFFQPDERIKQSFVRLCNRVCNSLIDYGLEHNLIKA